MKKCLKITLSCPAQRQQLNDQILAHARQLNLEGTLQLHEANKITIIACGLKDNIDTFLDLVHQGFGAEIPDDISIEPFLKDKDYRGIFRILE